MEFSFNNYTVERGLKKMNKHAKTSSSVWVMVIVGLIVLGGLVYVGNSFKESFTGGDGDLGDTIGSGCQISPFVSLTATDEINPGTSVTATGHTLLDDKLYGSFTSGSTTFVKGAKLDIIAGASGYTNKSIPTITLGCGGNSAQVELLKLDGAPTIQVFNDAGQVVTDGAFGATVNQTSRSTNIVQRIKVTAPADEGMEYMVITVEYNNDTELKSMDMSSVTPGVQVNKYKSSKPDFHAQEGAGSRSEFKSFEVTGMPKDGGVTELDLVLEPATSQTLGQGFEANGTSVYTTYYFGQDIIDTDAEIRMAIENSDGTAVHLSSASTDYDWIVSD